MSPPQSTPFGYDPYVPPPTPEEEKQQQKERRARYKQRRQEIHAPVPDEPRLPGVLQDDLELIQRYGEMSEEERAEVVSNIEAREQELTSEECRRWRDHNPGDPLPQLTRAEEAYIDLRLKGTTVEEAFQQSHRALMSNSDLAARVLGVNMQSMERHAAMLETSPRVQAWLRTINYAAISRHMTTVEEHCGELRQIRELAKSDKQYNVALRAEMAMGQIAGHYVERHQHTHSFGRDMVETLYKARRRAMQRNELPAEAHYKIPYKTDEGMTMWREPEEGDDLVFWNQQSIDQRTRYPVHPEELGNAGSIDDAEFEEIENIPSAVSEFL